MEACDGSPARDPALEAALAVELPPGGPVVVHVRACGEAAWVLERAGFPPQRVELQGLVPRLRRRTVALLAAGLLEAVEVSAAAPAAPALEPWAGPDPAGRVLLEAALARQPPAPPPAPPVALQAEATARLFLLDPPTFAGGARLLVAPWGPLTVGLELAGGGATLATAQVLAALLAAQLGVRLLRLPVGPGHLEVGLEGEVGAAFTGTRSSLAGFVGTSAVDWLAGGAARATLAWPLPGGLDLRLGLRAGYDQGVQVRVLGAPALTPGGPFVALLLGLGAALPCPPVTAKVGPAP